MMKFKSKSKGETEREREKGAKSFCLNKLISEAQI